MTASGTTVPLAAGSRKPRSTADVADAALEQVGAEALRGHVRTFQERSAARGWHVSDLAWGTLDPERLDDQDRSVVQFITFIEDHIPGYLAYFLGAFPVAGADLPPDRYKLNREYFRFLVGWAGDEERHAGALTDYQVRVGMAREPDLLAALAVEGAKTFTLPYTHPLEAFVYTLVQEKATQLFYQRFAASVREPVLRELLMLMARDEARHFAFYSALVGSYVQVAPRESLRHMRDVVATFRMPLADTLHGYWRWSLRVADATAYDHTEAYEALTRLVRGFANARGLPEAEDLDELVRGIRRTA